MAEEAEEAEEGALSPFAEGLKPSPAATDEEEEEASVAIRERLGVVVGEEEDFFLSWVGEEEDLNLMSLPRTGMTGTERDGIRKTSDNTLLPLTIVFRFFFSPPFFPLLGVFRYTFVGCCSQRSGVCWVLPWVLWQ